jgi:2-succinyl-5-enolpyruvyl-6-hydroxy-3-cyclohexene-1-carboxylate synthase
LGSLASVALVTTPFVVAVVDNAGGRIFDQLPVEKLYGAEPEAAKLWLTPPGRDMGELAALFGLDYQAPTTSEDVARATARALSQNAATLLHLRVGPNSAAQLRKRVLAALAVPAEARG